MCKRILSAEPKTSATDVAWIDLEKSATVEVTSEDPEHPIEAALVDRTGEGWRASAPGEQSIRIVFDAPRRITRVALVFVETAVQRTQEIAVAWLPDGSEWREVLRQQWNFSPSGSMREEEDYRLDLDDVRAVQLTVNPDIGNPKAVASLARLSLG